MSGISNAVLEIKSRCNIVDVIGSVVPLKRSGSSYKACCPFHGEKTPSFNVSETHQYYHCFGCGESGDVFSFMEKYYHLSFIDSVEKLAAQYGVEIEKDSGISSKRRADLLAANKLSAKFFYNNLQTDKKDAHEYIKKRGLKEETIKAFGIGFAKDDWNSLSQFLNTNKIDTDIAKDLGLVSESKNKIFDKYRNRLIFPIIDTKGNVIGFGGRIIGDGEPKYLNSPESEVFKKKNNLFGLNKAKDYINEEGYAFLVEGYMDVVSLYQSGVRNVVASLGTALTENQAKLLHRYCNKVILCYDADSAGIKAAIRGIEVLRDADMEVKVLHVENAKDPDEYIKKFGKDAFIELASNKALNHVDYKLALISKKYKRNTPEQNIKFIEAVSTLLATLKPAEKEVYTDYLSKKLSISKDTLVKQSILANKDKAAISVSSEVKEQNEIVLSTADINLEMLCIRLSILDKHKFKALLEYEDAFLSPSGMAIASLLSLHYKDLDSLSEDVFRDNLSEESYVYYKNIVSNLLISNEDKAFNDCIVKLESKKAKNNYNSLLKDLKLLEELPESEDKNKDISICMKKIADLHK